MRVPVAVAVVLLCALALSSVARAAVSPADVRIAFVPIDDRPATSLFPLQIAAICGATIESPPREMLGHFQRPGDPEGVGRWLLGLSARDLTAVVVSSDMLAYGGLVASREPATSLGDAVYHLRALSEFHRLNPDVPVYVFGTVMRLAPTATPASEPFMDALAHYAELAGTPEPTAAQREALAISRSNIPNRVFWDYLGARARDLDVDESLIRMTSTGDIALLSLTQDDAGSRSGLQTADEAALHSLVDRMHLGTRVFLNPGTDEMGMVTIVRAVEDRVSWSPSVMLAYPSDDSSRLADPLEYQPIGDTIANLAMFLKMPVLASGADFALATNAPEPDGSKRETFFSALRERLAAGMPTAVADLSFVTHDPALERETFDALSRSGLLSRPLAFASWNTTANTVGTALAQSAATLIGKRFATLDRDAAATFLFDRYVDDFGYRQIVREPLQDELRAEGADVYALGDAAGHAESLARSMLWPEALTIFDEGFASHGYHAGQIAIHLPWQRTFEVRIDADVKAPEEHQRSVAVELARPARPNCVPASRARRSPCGDGREIGRDLPSRPRARTALAARDAPL